MPFKERRRHNRQPISAKKGARKYLAPFLFWHENHSEQPQNLITLKEKRRKNNDSNSRYSQGLQQNQEAWRNHDSEHSGSIHSETKSQGGNCIPFQEWKTSDESHCQGSSSCQDGISKQRYLSLDIGKN